MTTSISPLPETPVESVYVHSPFCARRCFYCDFAVEVRRTGDVGEWAAAIEAELDARLESGVALADRLRTLYVGGGTPSLLGSEGMHRLREVLGRERCSAGSLEWTAEANPESLTFEVARRWREAGVTRLSLGVQSFEAPVLRWMGRLHDAAGAARAVEVARTAGFEEISIDLVFGLPDTVQRDWTADLGRAVDLEVPHVSLYGLTAEPGTGLGRGVEAGRVRMVDDDRYREEFLEAHERLVDAGFRHYEVSNFALVGSESQHNISYWDRSPYLGLGNGAHSFVHPVRWWNHNTWSDYRTAVAEAGNPTAMVEYLDSAADRLEVVWTGLRTEGGLEVDLWGDRVRERVEAWIHRGLATEREGRVRLTPEGWLLLDGLVLEFDEVAERARPGPPPTGPGRVSGDLTGTDPG